MEHDHKVCMPLLLQPYLWLVLIIEIVVGAVSVLFNCAIAVSSYYTLTIPFFQRRTFAIIALNYAFLASILLAKKCFFLFAAHYPCISVVSSVSCKLQEFPTVFSYIHAAILPLVLALQCLGRESDHRKEKPQVSVDWTSACSVHQTTVLIFCLGLSLIFTAFDQDFSRELLHNCSIVVAIQQKNIAFWLITLLILVHSLSALLWYFLITLVECLFWLVTLFFTGIVIVNQFISVRECIECSIFAIEICFTLVPLLISVLHPVVVAWLNEAVRKNCVNLFPVLSKFVPAEELDTPPLPPRLPLPHSNVRILITKSPETPTSARRSLITL
uniref:G-protein coupled receptors family 1 profile domain-containing protein n=1 Tax=Ditylenchus dipsaci TaxID=166011 RepID=A0A915EC19_9BILA